MDSQHPVRAALSYQEAFQVHASGKRGCIANVQAPEIECSSLLNVNIPKRLTAWSVARHLHPFPGGPR